MDEILIILILILMCIFFGFLGLFSADENKNKPEKQKKTSSTFKNTEYFKWIISLSVLIISISIFYLLFYWGAEFDYCDNKYCFDKNGNFFTGTRKEYYDNGKLFSKSYYKSGLKNGDSITYYSNGNMLMKEHYENGKIQGKVILYYSNGKERGRYDALDRYKNPQDAIIDYYNGKVGIQEVQDSITNYYNNIVNQAEKIRNQFNY